MALRNVQIISAKAAANWSISDLRYAFPPQLRPPPNDASLPALIPWLHELSKVSRHELGSAQTHLRKAVLLRLKATKKVEKHEVTVEDVKTALLRIRKQKAKEIARRRKGLIRPKGRKCSVEAVNQGVRRSVVLDPQFQERSGCFIVVPSNSSESDSGIDLSSEDEAAPKEILETPQFLIASPSSVLDTPYHKQGLATCGEDTGRRRLLSRIDRLREEHDDHRRLAGERLASVARHRRDARSREAKIEQLEGVLRARN